MKKKIVIIFSVMSAVILSAEEVSVMSFNIRYGTAKDGDNSWSNRKELVFDVVKEHGSDVIGLQEALRFQIDEIRKAVPGFGEIGQGRDGLEKGEYSAILYKKDRFESLSSGTFWLSDTPDKPSITWGNGCIRICTWARFLDKESKKEFYVYNTHLDHVSQPSREKSVRLIARRIKERKHKDPFVLTGDFNAGEDNPVILYLKGDAVKGAEKPMLALRDTFRVCNPDEKLVGTANRFKGRNDGAKIDYIFVQTETDVVKAEILRPPKGVRCPSDHYPVTAKLRF